MKSPTRILLGATLLLLSAVVVIQWREISANRREIAALSAERQSEILDRESQTESLKTSGRQLAELRQQVRQLSGVVAALRASGPHPPGGPQPDPSPATPPDGSGAEGMFGGGKMGEFISKMMKDPAMKEALRNQQQGMINMMYAPLFRDLKLPPEKQEALKQILMDRQMAAMDHAETLFSKDPTGKTAMQSQLVQDEAATEAKIKDLLGEDLFNRYDDYKKTMPDRMSLDQFKAQVTGGASAISDDQTSQLLLIMREERERMAADTATTTAAGDPSRLFSAEGMEQQIKRMEDQNKRVLDRAGGVLTAEQLQAFKDFQATQAGFMRMGLKMAGSMMIGK